MEDKLHGMGDFMCFLVVAVHISTSLVCESSAIRVNKKGKGEDNAEPMPS